MSDRRARSQTPPAQRWLAVSYWSGADGVACSHHVDDRLSEMLQLGVKVRLVTGVLSGKTPNARCWRIPSCPGTGLRYEILSRCEGADKGRWWARALREVGSLLTRVQYRVERRFLKMEHTWWWLPGATIASAMAAVVGRSNVIYSTGGPASAHVAAGLAAVITRRTWVAEFQDPLVHSYCARSERERRLLEKVERFVCRRADAVVFLTDAARRAVCEKHGLSDRGLVIYPGARAIPVAPRSPRHGRHFTMVHLGTLAGTRSSRGLVEALEGYLASEPSARSTLRVKLLGCVDPDSEHCVENSPVRDVIEIAPRISRRESLGLMRESDVLVLIQGVDDVAPQTIPSKAYEYLQSGTPILGLVHENEELAGMLRGLGHAVAAASDPADIAAQIKMLHGKWLAGEWPPECLRSPYTIRAAAERLVSVVSGAAVADAGDRLLPEQWADTLESTLDGDIPAAWHREITRWIDDGDSILELGAGTGRVARELNVRRKVLLDFSERLLQTAARNAPGSETLCHDIRATPWPFADREFQLSYSLGLLEHFSDDEIVAALREQGRVSELVLSLVPNANSFAYRFWKWRLERDGLWTYTDEVPRTSLVPHFQRAGLDVISEYTTDFDSLETFLCDLKLDQERLADVLAFLRETPDANQGYLLVTVGKAACT